MGSRPGDPPRRDGASVSDRLLTTRDVADRLAVSPETGVTPYTLRHSGISWALAAGIPASDVARFAGMSVTMLETTYAHLLEGSAEAARQRLDAFSERLGEERAWN